MKKTPIAIALTIAVGLTACSSNNGTDKRERETTNDIQSAYVTNQPIPTGSWSQLRQNLIEIETMQIEGASTWTYFFAPGRSDAAPVFTCASSGDPIPSTYQLSNPLKPTYKGSDGVTSINQIEPTGVFTGNTDGTNVICLDANGKGYKVYWEGQVMTATLQLEWNGKALAPVANAATSHEFTTKK